MEPDEIEKREFLVSLRGYDRDEVDAFAQEVAQELRELKSKLSAASAGGAAGSQAPGAAAPATTQAYERVGEDTSKILLAAEQVAEQIREKARREAAEMMADVRAEAEKLQREADAKRQESEDDLRKLREARTVLATQLEDVGRRLDESVARLRAPVEPAKPAKPAPKPEPKPAPASAPAPAPVPEPAPSAPSPAPTPKAEPLPPPAPKAETAPATSPSAPAAAPSKTEEEGASLETLLQQIRTEREEGRKEVEAALQSAAPAAPVAKTSEPAAEPAAAPSPAPVEPAVPIPSDSGMLARREVALGEVPKQAARRLKRLLQEDQNALLDLVRTQRGKGGVDENLVPTTEHHERFKQGLDEPLRAAFSSGRSLGGAAGPGDATSAIEVLVAKQLVGPLRAEIFKTVETGLEAQESANSLGERVSDVFRVWKGVRTELLGEGMVYAAFNQGLIDAWKSSGQKEKKWVLSPEEMECPNDVCKANAAAGLVSLDAGFPSGHLAPPAHGGCDCTLEST